MNQREVDKLPWNASYSTSLLTEQFRCFLWSYSNIFSDKRRLVVDIRQMELEDNTALNIKLTILNLVISVVHGASFCDIS
jgi:hypothetical protein